MSKLEEEYLEKAKQRQKDGIVKTQIVAGREFKGVAFISKPDKIIFKVRAEFGLFILGLYNRNSSFIDNFADKWFIFF